MNPNNQPDQWGMSPGDWNQLETTRQQLIQSRTHGFVPRIIHALSQAKQERDRRDTTEMLDTLAILKGFAQWCREEGGYTLFDTSSQPLEEPDYPEVDYDGAILAYLREQPPTPTPPPPTHACQGEGYGGQRCGMPSIALIEGKTARGEIALSRYVCRHHYGAIVTATAAYQGIQTVIVTELPGAVFPERQPNGK